ncbi:sensor histidine kinase [Microvirga tunisiensis]|uniref:histidine kinase n=1 Tax=Pannonibacter tanglangensis TaxID=2750084 RepID=A0A7X5F2D6_9HYPH|nr:HAMP domain-containing sensor histidine kinase [Pannonibacter sp. XCT-53]NBN78513.1 sensor histidine kinase [Pannonibacter sp. XCT-53]
MTRGSLRLRLMLAGAVSILVALAAAAFGLVLLFSQHVERRAHAALDLQMEQLLASLDRDPATGLLVVTRPAPDPRFGTPLSGLYWQIEGAGILERSRSLWDSTLTLPPDAARPAIEAHQYRLAGPAGETLVVSERHVTLPARLGGTGIRIAVAQDSADLAAATRDFAYDLLPYLALLALVLMLAAHVQVQVGLSPLGRVRQRLAAIRTDPEASFGKDFPEEVQPIGEAIDQLLEARRQQITRARQRAEDLAHGLKTPLQVLFGDASRLRQQGQAELAEDIRSLAETMSRHVERELAQARLAAGARALSCDAATVAAQVIAVVQRSPDGQRLTFELGGAAPLLLRIDPADLAEALGILLENASRHAAGRVVITLAGGAADQGSLTIRDDGPGIDPDRIDRLLERGARLDTSAAGTGLGLAILQDIVKAWSGTLVIVNHPEGGLSVTVTLPRAGSAPVTAFPA